MKRWLIALAAAVIIAPGVGTHAGPVQRRTVETVTMSFAVPDWIEWPPEFQPCGPAPLYYFTFELARITTIDEASEPVVEYRAGGGDGGCERGSGAYEGPVGPVVFELDALGNAAHVAVDLIEGGECCARFDFMLNRPSSLTTDCVASVVCVNAWTDGTTAGVSAGVALERSGYGLALSEYTFLLNQYPEPMILDLDVTVTRSTLVEVATRL